MRINKKVMFLIMLLGIIDFIFPLSFEELLEMTLESNEEIKKSLSDYENSLVTLETKDGLYAPTIIVSSSLTIPKDYEWNSNPDNFSSTLTYTQPFPGGTALSIETDYSFEIINGLGNKIMKQNPNLTLSISQSLFPFWMQRKKKEPIKFSLEKQKEYYYNELLYIKKTVVQNLFQHYINAFIARNEMFINQNNIELYDEQIEALELLKASGNVTQSRILEIENQRWTSQQALMTAQSNYVNYISQLKNIAGTDFDEQNLTFSIDEGVELLFSEYIKDKDPIELNNKIKIEMIENSRVLEKQSSAPVLNFSLQPKWSLGITSPDGWQDAWSDFCNPVAWKASLSVNLSPMISGIAKQNKKKYEINHKQAEENDAAYIKQKRIHMEQCENILRHFLIEKNTIEQLYSYACDELEGYKSQYEANAISKLDLDTVMVRVENCRLSKEIIELNISLYNILLKFLQ